MKKLLLLGGLLAGFTLAIAEIENTLPNPKQAKISPQEATSSAKSQVGGDVLGYELEDEDGRLVYGVKLIKDAEEYDVKVDANTGKVLKVEKEEEEED
ncbi:MAG: PepSY domain-containing protein [Hydrogenobacter sp.]